MAEQIITKRCCTCKQIKPHTEFYQNKARKDGHQEDCKVCHRKADRKYRQTETGKLNHRKGDRKYRQSEKGKITIKEKDKRYKQRENGKLVNWLAVKRFRAKHPEQTKAGRAVNHAIEAGKMARPDTRLCHSCTKPAQEYHHWRGYDPEHYLDVVPVCKKCHKKIHSLLRSKKR